MANISIDARDTVSAKLAECYATINGRRYNFAQMIDCEFKIEKTKSKVARLGATMVGHKTTGMEGTFSGNMHYMMSEMRMLLKELKDSGTDTYFEIQVTNEDPTSRTGRQTVVFYDCNTDGGILAKFDASSDDDVQESIEGTFEDFSIPETFKDIPGFLA